MTDDDIIDILTAMPGLSGYQIHRALTERSRLARWFGSDSLVTAIFGPSSGGTYVRLARLERFGRITSHWGVATPERGGHRPRHYFPRRGR